MELVNISFYLAARFAKGERLIKSIHKADLTVRVTGECIKSPTIIVYISGPKGKQAT